MASRKRPHPLAGVEGTFPCKPWWDSFGRSRFSTDHCDTMEALPLTIPRKVLVRVFLKLSAHFSGEQDMQTISSIGGGPSSEPQNRHCPRGKLLLEVDGIERTRAAVEKVAKTLKKHPATIYRWIESYNGRALR